MKAKGLTVKILLTNGFKESENEIYECFLQAYFRLCVFYNYLESRWSVWRSCGGVKQHLGYCKTVEQLNELLQKNNIDKEIIMSKAEELAEKAYPEGDAYIFGDASIACKAAYVKGYHQAEKDLELTLENIRTILNIENDILRECNNQSQLVIDTYPAEVDYYQEILKRFNKERKEK